MLNVQRNLIIPPGYAEINNEAMKCDNWPDLMKAQGWRQMTQEVPQNLGVMVIKVYFL